MSGQRDGTYIGLLFDYIENKQTTAMDPNLPRNAKEQYEDCLKCLPEYKRKDRYNNLISCLQDCMAKKYNNARDVFQDARKEYELLRSESQQQHPETRQAKTSNHHINGSQNRRAAQSVSSQPSKTYNATKHEEQMDIGRRSLQASIRLREGNANIADLSDVNRPTKIAEKFAELYDNIWTDAFEELTGDDRRKSQLLLEIIKDTYAFCSDISSQQLEALVKQCAGVMLFEKSLPRQVDQNTVMLLETGKTYIQQYRKDTAAVSVPCVIKKFLDNWLRRTTRTRRNNPKLVAYVERCTELCWWMCIHDPPLVIEFPSENRIDPEVFRPYTKSGGTVDFCVWPALKLHKKGPLLCKGVVQAK